ncbi:MAG TPA: lipid II flippase MurJ, partial [Aquihabitans sp.]|nr:lipid II flippase MurJ [Aquihabitans sp.]
MRPRTISPFGPPVPVPPPVEAFVDPTWHPPTGPVPVVDVDPGPDPEIWTTDDVAAPSPDAPGGGRRLLRANLVVASGTMVSRATGLVRTSLVLVLLAKSLGDAYLGANNTPNMIYELILGGILTASLVPLFTDDLERGDGQHATSAIISVAVLALLAVTALGFLAGPALILLFSTGSTAALRDDYVSVGVPLALLFAPQIFFYGLMAVWSALLNARHRFLAAAWAPVLNNLIAIATLWYAHTLVEGKPSLADALDDRRIIWVLGIGTTAGIATMALSLYPALRRSGFRFRWSPDRRHPAVRRAVRLSAWTLGYVIANQVAAVVIQILAKPASGDVTRYQTAFQFFQLPHALLAVSIMVTFEPLLGRADARGDLGDYNRQLLLGFRLIALLIIPAAVGYVALPKGLDARTFEVEGELMTRAFSIT